MTGFTRSDGWSGWWLSVKELPRVGACQMSGQGVILLLCSACPLPLLPLAPQLPPCPGGDLTQRACASVPCTMLNLTREVIRPSDSPALRGAPGGLLSTSESTQLRLAEHVPGHGRWALGAGRWPSPGPPGYQRSEALLWPHRNLGYRTKGNKSGISLSEPQAAGVP